MEDITLRSTTVKRTIDKPVYTDQYVSLNQHEFTLNIAGVGWFYACNGNYIEVVPDPSTERSAIELYLNGSVYGAILHQRKMMPMHGSCFSYQQTGVMLCGDSGVGKSSLTTAFCLDGADFLTDDVTPIVFRHEKAYVWSVSDRIKLWGDSLAQLNQSSTGLIPISPDHNKFYFSIPSERGRIYPLHNIFILDIHPESDVHIQPVTGIDKFTVLRNEIYRWQYLRGMPESEAAYLTQLIRTCQSVTITKVSRPANIPINDLRIVLEETIASGLTDQHRQPTFSEY